MDEVATGFAEQPQGRSELPSLRLLCHDLRQPLVVAVGYVSMLEDGSFGSLPDEAITILRTVAERLDAMNEMIDSMLEAGGQDAAPAAE